MFSHIDFNTTITDNTKICRLTPLPPQVTLIPITTQKWGNFIENYTNSKRSRTTGGLLGGFN